MSIDQAAATADHADCCPDDIGIVMVPNHLVPPDTAGALSPDIARPPGNGPDRTGTGGGAAGAPGARPPVREPPWAQKFAVLLAEVLTGARPTRQLVPWLSKRGSAQLHRLMPLFSGGHRPRVARVLTSMPCHDAVEMTMVVLIGPRARALAVRLERAVADDRATRPGSTVARWICTEIEAA
jgi:hypothetical protein